MFEVTNFTNSLSELVIDVNFCLIDPIVLYIGFSFALTLRIGIVTMLEKTAKKNNVPTKAFYF